MNSRKKFWFHVELVMPALVVLSVFFVYPLLRTAWLSLNEYSLMRGQSTFVGFGNYLVLLRSREFLQAMGHNLIYVAGVVAVNIVLGGALALFINQQYRGFKVLRFIIILPMLFIPSSSAVIWSLMFNDQFGIINHIWAILGFERRPWLGDPYTALYSVMMTDIWAWTPFVFLLILAGLQSLSSEPLEAARVDGASPYQVLRYVILPMLKPVLVVVILMKSIDTFKTFDYVWIMTRGGPGTASQIVSTYAYINAFSNFDFGLGSAIAMVSVIISQIMALLFIKSTRGLQ